MKTNKLFLGLLATGMLFSCTNDDEGVLDNPVSGKVNTSYIAVNVNSAYDVTRANGYENGDRKSVV